MKLLPLTNENLEVVEKFLQEDERHTNILVGIYTSAMLLLHESTYNCNIFVITMLFFVFCVL